jgi:hypothetical protein
MLTISLGQIYERYLKVASYWRKKKQKRLFVWFLGVALGLALGL